MEVYYCEHSEKLVLILFHYSYTTANLRVSLRRAYEVMFLSSLDVLLRVPAMGLSIKG